MAILIWILIGLTATALFASWPVYAKLRNLPEVPSGSELPEIRISVVIPARNEERNLSILLPSLSRQRELLHEIIVVDDHSHDCTRDIAEDNGVTVVAAPPLPTDWHGKPWAITQGVAAASGDWLLILDADTAIEQGAIEKLTLLSRRTDTVFAVCPYHTVEKTYEELSAFFNTIMILGTNAFTLRGEDAERIGLFGQMLFVKKSDYEKVGGHGAVRKTVLENFMLAGTFREAGLKCACYLGRGSARMRMFPGGYRELVDSWSKGFVSGAANTPPMTMAAISIWLSGLIMASTNFFCIPFASHAAILAIIALYGFAALSCLYLFRRIGNFAISTALLFPVGLVFYLRVFYQAKSRSEKRVPTQWKGRDVL